MPADRRRGISLLEVLISIGVIAIGLLSVVSLIPAGRSHAARALLLDRAAAAAANGLADAAAFGLLRPASLTSPDPSATAVVLDPAGAVLQIDGVGPLNASLKREGIFATAADAAAQPAAAAHLWAQARDDLAFLPPVDDGLPKALDTDGARSFEGTFTSLVAVVSADATPAPLAPGGLARVSVVVFHRRDLNAPLAVRATASGGTVVVTDPAAVAAAGLTLRDLLRPGTVIFEPQANRFSQVAAATHGTTTFVSYTGREPGAAAPILILPDSVGLAESIVTLEGTSIHAAR
jgi:type II secretory pathway pseudopilin PulG